MGNNFDQCQPFLEYLYYYQPYPKFGEKFLIRYDTKNSILDSSHYLRRPSIDEFIACGEINLLKIKSQLILNDFLTLYKYLLLDKFIYRDDGIHNDTNNNNNTNGGSMNGSSNNNMAMTNANQVNPIKIVITTRESSNILEVMNFVYSMTSLIYPFKYCGDILPFCDENRVLEHLINNRHTSSVIGFLQNRDFSFEKYLSSTNVIVFDFDSSRILNNLKEFKLISLPKENRVLTMLKNNILKYDTNARIMDFFVKCMASWFGNYRHHFKLHMNLFEFDHSRFLNDENHTPDSIDFYRAFSLTHLYKIFIDERTKLVNDYPTFQIQKIQFGRFEQECFKINPRIFTNASTSVSLTTNTSNNVSNSTSTNNNSSSSSNGANNSQGNQNSRNNQSSSSSNNRSTTNGGGNTSSSNNGFSLKHLFFKKTSNAPNQSNVNELPDEKHNDKSNSEIEPMSTSFGTKIISELQYSKENQLALSFYCRESDSNKTKFSFTELHQTIKPPKKYLPEFGELSIVTNEDEEASEDTNKPQSDLDVLLNDDSETSSNGTNESDDGEQFESINHNSTSTATTTPILESLNTVDNETIQGNVGSGTSEATITSEMTIESTTIESQIEIPPLTSTTTSIASAVPVSADEFYE